MASARGVAARARSKTATDATNESRREITSEFDALLADMQRPASRAAMKTAFGASPTQLGRAAVAAARKRG